MDQSWHEYRVLVGKPEGKRRLGRPKRRCENDTKMDLREMACDARNRMDLIEDRDGVM